MKTSAKNLLMLATVVLGFASVMYANSINCASASSSAACAPSLAVTYALPGQSPVTLSLGATSASSNGNWLVSYTSQASSLFSFTGGQVVSNPDPFVGFSFGVINTSGSNMTFSYSFATPFVGGPYSMAQTVFVDTLLNTAFAGTATVTPVGDPFIMESDVNGVLIPGFGRGTGCVTAPSPLFFCQSGAIGAIGPVSYLSTATGNLTVSGSFMLTTNSQYTVTGRTDLLAPVPEPGTMMLLGSGLLGLAGIARRRMSK